MATFKAVVFKHHKKADGTFNIKIRVTQNRKKKYISTPFFCYQADLTRNYEIKSRRYLDICRVEIDRYYEKLEKFGMAVKKMTIERVLEIILSNDTNVLMYSDVLEEYARYNKIENNTYRGFTACLHNLCDFFHKDDIDLCSITSHEIQDWINSLTSNSAYIYKAKFSALINYVIKTKNDEDAGVYVIKTNPFSKVVMPKKPTTKKKAISVDELRNIIEYECDNKGVNFARNMFMLSFYLVGMNIVDIYSLSKEQLKSEYIEYERAKVKKRRADNAYIRIKVYDEARMLVEDVFDSMHAFSSPNSLSAYLNGKIKVIGNSLGIDGLIMYSARHTWATLAVNDCEIDKYTVHLALNHIDEKTAITDTYIKKDFSIIDKANRKVIDYVLGK